jgi:hypothetical protein
MRADEVAAKFLVAKSNLATAFGRGLFTTAAQAFDQVVVGGAASNGPTTLASNAEGIAAMGWIHDPCPVLCTTMS